MSALSRIATPSTLLLLTAGRQACSGSGFAIACLKARHFYVMYGPAAPMRCLARAQRTVAHSRCLETGATPVDAAKVRPPLPISLSGSDAPQEPIRNGQPGF